MSEQAPPKFSGMLDVLRWVLYQDVKLQDGRTVKLRDNIKSVSLRGTQKIRLKEKI